MWIVFEIQVWDNIPHFPAPKYFDNEIDAKFEYLTADAYACKSNTDMHTVVLMRPDGFVERRETHTHTYVPPET